MVWLPQVNPRLALLVPLPQDLFDGPGLSSARPIPTASAAEGVYLDLTALPPSRGALVLNAAAVDAPIGFVLPFDSAFEDRVEAARRLFDLLTRGRRTTATISAYRRRRLKLALRALDASLDGADYRAIAEALFGGRVPRGAAFRDDSLRAQAIRLVRYGLTLMNGGYLALLRPERRASRRRRPRGG